MGVRINQPQGRALLGGVQLPPLPVGYVFYVDLDGRFLLDIDGNFLIGPA